jgi:hypothetical protein
VTSIWLPWRAKPNRVPCSCPSTFSSRHQAVEVGHHQADRAAQHLRGADRQVELAAADVDPGIVDTGLQERVPSEPEAHDVEHHRLLLVGHAQVHVAELHDVADVFGAAVERVVSGVHALPSRRATSS